MQKQNTLIKILNIYFLVTCIGVMIVFQMNLPEIRIFLHALNYYYKEGYKYIEVGDGDELWEYKNFKVIRLAHTDVFTVIKKFYDEDRFIILYGNHNIYLKSNHFVKENYYQYYDEYNQTRVELFKGLIPQEALILEHKESKQKIFVLHGHQGDFMNDQLWVLGMLLLRYFWRYLHIVGFDNPTSPARNFYKRHKVEKAYDKWIEKYKTMLICGHTHDKNFLKPMNFHILIQAAAFEAVVYQV